MLLDHGPEDEWMDIWYFLFLLILSTRCKKKNCQPGGSGTEPSFWEQKQVKGAEGIFMRRRGNGQIGVWKQKLWKENAQKH